MRSPQNLKTAPPAPQQSHFHPAPRTLLAAGITIVLWASAFAGIRVALQSYRPETMALLRFGIASATLAMYALLRGLRGPEARLHLPTARDWPVIVLLGFLGFPAYHIALNYGELTVPAGPAAVLINTAPIFTAMLANIFLHERLRGWGWLGISICFAGVVVIATDKPGHFQFDPRSLFVLLAAFIGAIYFVIQKPLLRRYNALQITCYSVWSGTALMLVFLPRLLVQMRTAPTPTTLAVIYLGVLPAALGYFTWAYVLSRMPASMAATIMYLVGPLSFVIAWLWLGEAPAAMAMVGTILVICGVVVVNRWGGKRGGHAETQAQPCGANEAVLVSVP